MGASKYEKSFKEDVVNFALNYEGSIAEVARKFGIKLGTLYGWLGKQKEHGEEAFVGSGNLRSKDNEIKKLKKELMELKEENLILKKVAAIFSKQ